MQNLSQFFSRTLMVVVTTSLLCLTPAALAIPTPAPTKCMGDLVTVVKCLYNEARQAIYLSLTENNPNAPATVAGNVAQQNATVETNTASRDLTLNETKNALSRQGKSDSISDQLSLMPTSGLGTLDTSTRPFGFGAAAAKAIEAKRLAGDQSLSFTSLINPPTGTYTPEQAAAAQRFILYVAQMAKPLSSLELGKLSQEQLDNLRRNNFEAYQDYILDLRSIVAAQSVAISNLNYLYAQRVERKSPNPNVNKSLLAQEQELANRRADNPDWYDQMQNATPATVQRETLFVLAEIRKQMYQNYLMQQRILATLSTMELQNVASAKQLLTTKEKVLGDALARR